MTNIENPCDIRKTLWMNGYLPLANRDKVCKLPGWTKIVIDEARIERWKRSTFLASGIRLDNLAFLDVDIAIREIIETLLLKWFDYLPDVFDIDAPNLLERGTTASCKVGFFFRTKEVTGGARTPTFRDVLGKFHKVELWANTPGRQAGAFGAHGEHSEYVWHYDRSPLTVPLRDLPELTQEQLNELLKIAETVMRASGLEEVKPEHDSGEAHGDIHYDLSDTMTFFDPSQGDLTLDELKAALALTDSVRLTGAWHDPTSTNDMNPRCIARLTKQGKLLITDFADDSKHMEPLGVVDDASVTAAFSAFKPEPGKAPPPPPPKATVEMVAGRLLAQFCLCPSLQSPVVEILDPDHRMSKANFIDSNAKFGEMKAVAGSTKQKFVNPVTLWLHDDKRITIRGIQTRPDMTTPFYEEDGQLWLNRYQPPVHDAEPMPGGAALFVDFMRHLIPDPVECEWQIDRLAHKYQNPAIPGPGVIMVAKQPGTGRGTLFAMLRQLFGTKFTRKIDPSQFTGEGGQSQYTDWLVNSVALFVDELVSPGHSFMWQRKRIAERWKLLVDPGARTVSVIQKFMPNYDGISYASVWAATNRHNAMPMEADDRRTVVTLGGETLESNGPLAAALAAQRDGMGFTAAFIAAVAACLLARDVSAFDPYAPPPMFEGKQIMIDAATSDATEVAQQVLQELPGDFIARKDLIRRVKVAMQMRDQDYRQTASMVEEARDVIDHAWVYMGTQKYQENGSKADVWARNQRAATKWRNTPLEGRPQLLKANADQARRLTDAQMRAMGLGIEIVDGTPEDQED